MQITGIGRTVSTFGKQKIWIFNLGKRNKSSVILVFIKVRENLCTNRYVGTRGCNSDQWFCRTE